MEMPSYLRKDICPEKGKKIDYYDRKTKYLVKVEAPQNLSKSLFDYAEYFHDAAYEITKYILTLKNPDIGKLDTYIFAIAFLYRHCMELGLKAIGFQKINNKGDQIQFVNTTRHNLAEILKIIEKLDSNRSSEEIEWLNKYFANLSKIDRESDSFRYPFHIVKQHGRFDIKPIFDDQTNIDLKKFASKFEASYEIIRKWYKKESEETSKWKNLNPIFIETGGNYYAQSVVGYKYRRESFYPYTRAYMETANYLKWIMQQGIDSDDYSNNEHLFLPMCYLYRNCVELYLKTIWFEVIGEDFQAKCKVMLDKKHSILGMWNEVKPYIEEFCKSENDIKNMEVIENYCMQIHTIDSDASKFRYPMSKNLQAYFSQNKRFDFVETGDFFEALNNCLDGIEAGMAEMMELRAEIEAEYRAEMESEYMI